MKSFKTILKRILIALGIAVGVCIAGIIILTATTMHRSKVRMADLASRTPAPYVVPELGFEVADSIDPLPLDTYNLLETTNMKALSIYDAAYLDLFFENDSVTAEEVKQVVRDNDDIAPKYKELLYWYIDAIAAKYPEADLRPLHYNLQTIEVVERTSHELAFDSLSLTAYGCYRREENKIYVNKDYEYAPGTWEYQVILHEFGHAARTVQRNEGLNSLRIQLSAEYLEIPEEALNSLFTVSLFDYEERDIAYQLQSNMFQVMIECLDGKYLLSDYINHSLSYLARTLDQHNGDTNYAMAIFRLIGEQRADYINDRYERDQDAYYPIYDYLCRMYLNAHAPSGGSEEEIRLLVGELLEKIMYDVPEDYHIDTEEFYRYAAAYKGNA